MSKILLILFYEIFSPKKLLGVGKESIFVPFTIIFIKLITPNFLPLSKYFLLIFFLSFLSVGFRSIFSKNNNHYAYLGTSFLLIFGNINYTTLLISIIWMSSVKFYLDLKLKNYLSMIISPVFEFFILWWLL